MRQRISRTTVLSIVIMFFSITSDAQGSTGAIAPSLSANSNKLVANAPDSRGWTDPALNHNKLLVGNGTYVLVGHYKVMGSPYLFGEHSSGDLFSEKEKAYNININYNTYNQEVEFISTGNAGTPLVKTVGEVDSFILRQHIESGIMHDMKFVYGPLAGSMDKTYFLELAKGSRFSFYKRYHADLGYPSGNYSQAEVRQFDLLTDYYYYDAEKKTFKKLKFNLSSIIKEFKGIKDITPVANSEAFSANPEDVLVKVAAYLNS
jgi:hypothetical protein